MATVYAASEEQLPALDSLAADMASFTDAVERIGPDRIAALCPVARTGEGHAIAGLYDPTGIKLEAAALLQGCARAVRVAGSQVLTGRRVARVARTGNSWEATTEAGETFSAPILINAAGAWSDRIAAMGGVTPIGLQPKRRTIIVVDPPAGMEIASWPFFHSAGGDFYMLPEAGQILVSPADEVDDEPSDAAPEEYDAALAAYRLEHYTTLSVTRIAHRWAGLRSFVADRTPTAGFDPDAPGFFWLVGQGGYGLQTCPAMAAIVEALVAGLPWPDGLEALGLGPEQVGPGRLRGGSSQGEAT
jgi:D-arginine dehydrogenase